MRDHDDSERIIAPQAGDEAVHVGADAGIERAKGFVEQEDARALDQGLRNGKALLHAARHLRRIKVEAVGKAHRVEHGRSLAHGLAACAAEEPRGEGRGRAFKTEHDIGEHSHMREHRVALKHHAAIGAAFGFERLAIEQDRAARRCLLTEDQAQEAGLTRARGADDREERTLGHFEVDLFEHDLVAVFDPDVLEREERVHLPSPCAQGKARRLTALSETSIRMARSAIHAT